MHNLNKVKVHVYDYLHFIKSYILKRFVSDELPVLYSREKEKDNIQKHHTQSARKEKLSITQS